MVHEKIEWEASIPKATKTKQKGTIKGVCNKTNVQMANQNWNDWKFQIHWNKHDWVNPRSHIEWKNPFCAYSKTLFLKDNNNTVHWVGYLKLKPLDKYIF